MSDVMLLGVLRMPIPDNPDPLTLNQFVSRARQAADRIESDAAKLEELSAEVERLRSQQAESVADVASLLMCAGRQINSLHANERRLIDELFNAKKDADHYRKLAQSSTHRADETDEQFVAAVEAAGAAPAGKPPAVSLPLLDDGGRGDDAARLPDVEPAPLSSGRDEQQKYGCHCDLEPDMAPDGCVLDGGGWSANDCRTAMTLVSAGKDKTACEHWRPINISSKVKVSDAN